MNNLFHGHGKYMLANGDVYEGDFDKGAMHGYGILTYANGKKDSKEIITLC